MTVTPCLGVGGFSTVYLCGDIAIKAPFRIRGGQIALLDEGESSLLREQELLFHLYKDRVAALSHCIVDYRGLDWVSVLGKKTLCLILKAEESSLDKHLGLSLEQVRRIFKQLAKALWYIKAHGIIHGDIKPENILLSGIGTNQEQVKLTDFGNSFKEQEYVNSIIEMVQTRWYRSPEEIVRLPRTCAMDMWSLAAVIFEVYTKQCLSAGATISNMISLHQMRCQQIYPLEFLQRIALRRGITVDSLFSTFTKTSVVSSYQTAIEEQAGEEIDKRQLLDLLGRMLVYEPQDRIETGKLLEHPFINRESDEDFHKEVVLPQEYFLPEVGDYTGEISCIYRLADRVVKLPVVASEKSLDTSFFEREEVLLREKQILAYLQKEVIQTAAYPIIKSLDGETCFIRGKIVCSIHLEAHDMTCAEYMDRYPAGLSLLRTCQIAQKLAQALVFLQEKKVIHGDVHPTNILFSHVDLETERVVLTDFNRSFIEEEIYTPIDWTRNDISYQPPEEMLLETKKSYPMDMWSLALVIVKVFMGKPLFAQSMCFWTLAAQEQLCLEREHPLEFATPSFLSIVGNEEQFLQLKTGYCGKTLRQRFDEKGTEAMVLYDLINQMLAYLPEERILPSEFLEKISAL